MEKQKKICFNKGRVFHSKIILSFCIAGLKKNYFHNHLLPLYYYPKHIEANEWTKRIKDIDYGRKTLVDKPEFLLSYLKSSKNGNTFLYGIKFTENNILNNNRPVLLLLESSKDDPEEFQHLLFSLYEHFIVIKQNTRQEINYKKIEFINILFFLYYNLIPPSPHSSIEINFPFLNNQLFQTIFYYSSNFELPCNKTDTNIFKLFSYLDVSIIIKIIFKLLVEKSVLLISQDHNLLNTILPAISSLLFPIKWTYPFNPICSSFTNITNNEKHYLYGCIGGEETFQSILKVAGENFVVDCDTNEVYNGEKYVQFCPLPTSQFCCQSERVLMVYDYYKNSLYEVDEETGKRQQLLLLKNGRVLIDCDDDNRLVIELKDNYLSKEEWKTLRERIQYLKKEKTFMEIEDEINNNNEEDDINNNLNQERSFDYKMKKIFAEIIYSKITDGYLYYSMRSSTLMVEFKKVDPFENDSPSQIVKNVFQSDEKDSKRNYYNSFRIILDIPHLENNQTLQNIFNTICCFDIYNDYLKLLQNERIDNKNETYDTFIYGREGIVKILENIENSIDNIDAILEEIYSKQILTYILQNVLKKEKVGSISFKSGNEESIEYCHQFYNYIALLFNELRNINIHFVLPSDTSRDEMITFKMMSNFLKGYYFDKNEFPFFSLYSILNNTPKTILNKIKFLFDNNPDFFQIYQNIQ